MADEFDAMAEELARIADPTQDVCEAGYACGFQAPYGFVPEADCPVHDAPKTFRPAFAMRRDGDTNG